MIALRLAFRAVFGKLRGLMVSKFQFWDGCRYVLAILAGGVWALAFPKASIEGFAWLAPGLMLAVTAGRYGAEAFRLGYVAGLVNYLVSLYWLLLIPVEVSPEAGWLAGLLYRMGPLVGWLALSGFLALYPAVWVGLAWFLYPARLTRTHRGPNGLVDSFLQAPRWQRLSWALNCAALWVALEMAQARLLTGFPWNLLGASQYRLLPIIQIASLTGVYGISFLMVWFSVSLLGAVALMIRLPQRRESWMLELIVPLLCVAGVVAYGWRGLVPRRETESATVKLALIQPSIPQSTIWNPESASERFDQVIALSQRALTQVHPDILVWPEAAVPGFALWDTPIRQAITNLVCRHGVWLVLGSDDLALAARSRETAEYDYFNSAFLVSPEGRFVAGYRKRKLVMFGEYVPLARWLPFLKYLTPISGGFTPGTTPGRFVWPDRSLKASVLICFEDIFPHLVRGTVDEDTDFLINLTNNGWFGESAAQWQHAANAAFRAVENGLPLVRCANNGLSCWVDAQGRLREVFFPNTSDIYGRGWKVAEVPTLAGTRRPLTLYGRYGDWFGWGCVGLTLLLVAGKLAFRRRGR